jgi:uncharacterized membrane protein SpoIIM required for sporulation
MSIVIRTPQNLISRHPDAFTVSLIFFLIGFMLGLQPEYSQPIIEEAQKRQIEPTATATNFKTILINNGLISGIIWAGWFFTPFLGLAYLPPAIMVYNVGVAFGAVVSHVSAIQSIITIFSFGIIEALGFIFALSSSLLFPKYVLQKLLGKTVYFSETLTDAATSMLYSFLLISTGAVIEALLINPVTQILAIIIGTVTTIYIIKFLTKKVK